MGKQREAEPYGLIIGRAALERPATLPVQQPNPQDTCEHEWQFFKEQIQVDHVVKTLPGGHQAQYTGGAAWFKVKACIKCHLKQYLDYWHD